MLQTNDKPFGSLGPRYPQATLDRMKTHNNPKNEPTGPFTGRCPHCGSNRLWDDNMAYGCKDCGALLGTN